MTDVQSAIVYIVMYTISQKMSHNNAQMSSNIEAISATCLNCE